MVQLKYICLQIIIINAIGLSNAIRLIDLNKEQNSGISRSAAQTLLPPPATNCEEINCGPSHVCQVVRKGFCVPLLPCPSIATCIPVATPRIGVITTHSRYGSREKDRVKQYNELPRVEALSKKTEKMKSKNTNRQQNKLKQRKKEIIKSDENRGEYKGIVKGLSTPKLPQFPFLDQAQKTLMTGFYNSFYPHSSRKSLTQAATKPPLVFITQRDIEKRLRETRNKDEKNIFSLLHGLRHVKPFFRLKGPGISKIKRVDRVKEDFHGSERLRSTPAPTIPTYTPALQDSQSSFTPSQPFPIWKMADNDKIKVVKKKKQLSNDIKTDAQNTYQALMDVLNEKRKKNTTKIIIHHNGFQPKPKNKAQFEFNMKNMREQLKKIKAKEVFAPMLTKMFSRNSKNTQITATTKRDEKPTATTTVTATSTTTTDAPLTDEVATETTANNNTSDDNKVSDPTNWLEIEKIHPKRRKIVSRRNKKEKIKNKPEIKEEDKMSQGMLSRRFGFLADDLFEYASDENMEGNQDGSKVPETYKMDFNRPIIKKHIISLDEFDDIMESIPQK